MSEPFIGEIRMVGFNFAPTGWAFCNGQTLPIASNAALYSILGTTYGGNGESNFALPDLRGRAPLHVGGGPGLSSYSQGQIGGLESVTLTEAELPSHDHQIRTAAAPATDRVPADSSLAVARKLAYAPDGDLDATLATGSLGNTGGGQAHTNMQPSLAVNYVIALVGVFPPLN